MMILSYFFVLLLWIITTLSMIVMTVECAVMDTDTTTGTTTGSIGCPCGELVPRPDLWQKGLTARWMVHSLDWGVLTTLSQTRGGGGNGGVVPFGNVYSFIDGSCLNATGTPYFYGTYMDQSFQDMERNPVASFTLSEASLTSTCSDITTDTFVEKACVIVPSQQITGSEKTTTTTRNDTVLPGDPENPLCARLTLSGTLVEVTNETTGSTTTTVDNEYEFIRAAFYERHPQMIYWPQDHNWKIVKLVINEIWIIDFFGGATILSPEQYYDIHNNPLQQQRITTDGF